MATAQKSLHIFGRVIGVTTRLGVKRLRVEAWDKDMVFNDQVGRRSQMKEEPFKFTLRSRFRESLPPVAVVHWTNGLGSHIAILTRRNHARLARGQRTERNEPNHSLNLPGEPS